jgi:hypothetical protein
MAAARDFLIQRVLVLLERELNSLAHSALNLPAERDSFEYGRMAGMYAGLRKAIELVDGSLDEDSEEEDHGVQRRGTPRAILRT